MEMIFSFFGFKKNEKEIKEYETFDTRDELEKARMITDWKKREEKIAEIFETANRLLYERRKDYGLFECDRKKQKTEFDKLPKDEKERIIKTKKND